MALFKLRRLFLRAFKREFILVKQFSYIEYELHVLFFVYPLVALRFDRAYYLELGLPVPKDVGFNPCNPCHLSYLEIQSVGYMGHRYWLILPPEFTKSLRSWLGLKVITVLASMVISEPVWGFLPRRAFFLRTTKFPKPDIFTLSPFSSELLIVSKTLSTTSETSFFEQPTFSKAVSTRSALVIKPSSFKIFTYAAAR